MEEKGWRKGRKEGKNVSLFFSTSALIAMADQTTLDENSLRIRVKQRGEEKGEGRGGDGNKRGLDICTPVERTKQRVHLWHSFSDPRRDKRNDEVRAKVQGKSRGIDRGDAWCRVEQS